MPMKQLNTILIFTFIFFFHFSSTSDDFNMWDVSSRKKGPGIVLKFDPRKKKPKDKKQLENNSSVEKIIPIETKTFKFYIQRGIEAMDFKEYEVSIDYFKQAIEINPNHYLSYYNRGMSYYYLASESFLDPGDENNFDESEDIQNLLFSALKDLEHSIKLKETSFALYTVFFIYLKVGDFNSANEYLERLLNDKKSFEDFKRKEFKNDLSETVFYYQAGYTKANILQFGPALVMLDKAISIDSSYFPAYVVKSNIFLNLNKKKQALHIYDKYIQKNVKSSQYKQWLHLAHFYRGRIFFSIGEKEKAFSDFSISYQLSPRTPVLNYYYGMLLLEKQKSDFAIEVLSQGIDVNNMPDEKIDVFDKLDHIIDPDRFLIGVLANLYEVRGIAFSERQEHLLARKDFAEELLIIDAIRGFHETESNDDFSQDVVYNLSLKENEIVNKIAKIDNLLKDKLNTDKPIKSEGDVNELKEESKASSSIKNKSKSITVIDISSGLKKKSKNTSCQNQFTDDK